MIDNFGRWVIVPEVVPEDWEPGWNKDRGKCKKCKYRGRGQGEEQWCKNRCNYIEHAGHSRGCKVEDCFLFEKGNRKRINTRVSKKKEKEYAD